MGEGRRTREPHRTRPQGAAADRQPYVDLCLWKGRFPSTQRRFCTEELKSLPLDRVAVETLTGGQDVVSWQGVRAEESKPRTKLP